MYNEFNEQINKSAYYEQQGKGELDIKRYQRLPRQRGQGKIWSLAQRYAFPAGRFLLSRAMPIIKDLLSDLKPGVEIAKTNIKQGLVQDYSQRIEGANIYWQKLSRLKLSRLRPYRHRLPRLRPIGWDPIGLGPIG